MYYSAARVSGDLGNTEEILTNSMGKYCSLQLNLDKKNGFSAGKS